MLSQNFQQPKSAKINECILRRRARNLRAKVKTLLPVQICHKHSRRNKNVRVIKENKKLWDTLKFQDAPRRWQISQQKQDVMYCESSPCINRSQRFQKLTHEEIEQIKEDRMYYLGEDYIVDFQNYLDERLSGSQPRRVKTSQWHRISTNLSRHHQSSRQKRAGAATENLKENLNQYPLRQHHLKQANQQRFMQFQQRRQNILQEEQSKIITNRVKMRMKLERASKNLELLQEKIMNKLEEKKNHSDDRAHRVKSRRLNELQKTEILPIQEILRKTCLARFNRMRGSGARTKLD